MREREKIHKRESNKERLKWEIKNMRSKRGIK